MKRIDVSQHQHKFISNTGGRCIRCQIKESYFYEAIGTLERWPEREKDAIWIDKVLGYLTCPAIGAQGWKGPDRSLKVVKS